MHVNILHCEVDCAACTHDNCLRLKGGDQQARKRVEAYSLVRCRQSGGEKSQQTLLGGREYRIRIIDEYRIRIIDEYRIRINGEYRIRIIDEYRIRIIDEYRLNTI